MIKNLAKILVKGLIFLVLFFLIILTIEPLFSESKNSVWTHFYAQEKNSVDILVLGNSHANAGIDEDIVKAKLNANLVSLATRGQNIYQSYYCALEAYKYQTPKVLIIENYLFYERLTLDKFIHQDPSKNDYLKRYLTFEGKKIGKVKYEESRKFFQGNFVENMFASINKHERWTDVDEIKKRLYIQDSIYRNKSIYIMSNKRAEAYELKKEYDLMTYNILPDEEIALKSIIELAKERGTERIILLTIPFYNSYRNKIDYNSFTSPFKKYVTKNPGIEYIDLNVKFPDWDNTYFTNEPVGYNQHVNYKGAIKVSNNLSNVIKTKFNYKKDRSLDYYLYNEIQKDSIKKGNRIIGNLERLNGEKRGLLVIDKPDTVIKLEGWMAIENYSSDENEMFIGLKRDNDFIYISDSKQLKRKERKDVSKYFDKTNIYDNSGFQIFINSKILEKGTYAAYLMIRNNKGEVAVKSVKKTIKIL
ncbi:hypothetical protein [Winogradskyella wichelsiae]|uniref:hypothetical protein n=1 Tax=Winogradskyella wichelsiae TaxID=2697007 RepID=UPI003EF9108A